MHSEGDALSWRSMAFFMLQKRPDGQSSWDDSEGTTYKFSQRLPNATKLCKNDVVLFYRPTKSGTPEDGCIFATAKVCSVVLGDKGIVDAELADYIVLQRPVSIGEVGDPRRNAQHSFQPVSRAFFHQVLQAAGGNEGASA